jgi:NADPH-dependent glutamate synthase beta subunit-like oxidoreductase/NAD(P)H-flavin reductase
MILVFVAVAKNIRSVVGKSNQLKKLGISGFTWSDLSKPTGLKRLFDCFCDELQQSDVTLSERYQSYLTNADIAAIDESQILVDLAPKVSSFIAKLFCLESQTEQIKANESSLEIISLFKRDFITRKILKKYKAKDVCSFDEAKLHKQVSRIINDATFDGDNETCTARFVLPLLEIQKLLEKNKSLSPEQDANLNTLAQRLKLVSMGNVEVLNAVLEPIEKWVAALYYKGNASDWASFKLPEKLDYDHLVESVQPDADLPEKFIGPDESLRRRDGFALTDCRMDVKHTLGEVNYCIYCHSRDKDSCSKGLLDNKTKVVQKNPLDITLSGCPLDEKISEANILRKQGDIIATLATIMVDNPMCPGTGHRICNDCMKSCIFQKQEPVNIPEVETNTLTQVLDLPFGFEIYSFLAKWNPLNRKRPYALPYNGKNILVVGMGPAGYTLTHYLLNEGFGVVGIDGLKIEPLSDELTAKQGDVHKPIEDTSALFEDLDKRILTGFGGVAEYGITVRWDKNFLKLIYLNLLRRDRFKVFGGIRFGGTLTIEDAWKYGFDHIAMATGAGKPTIIPVKNNLIRGVRKASDFLMGLQLTGAFKKNNLSNLLIRLPAVVIGGGLTGVDTATEIMAYYPVQVEKFLTRYEQMLSVSTEEKLTERLSEEDKEIMQEYITHGQAIREERKQAEKEGVKPGFVPLIKKWGGVSLVYRKRMFDSPAYRLNHEEVVKALEEGIYFIEQHSPAECLRGKHGSLDGVVFEKQFLNDEGKWRSTGDKITLPARSMCVAAGTSPNTVYEKEQPGSFIMDEWKWFFQKYADNKGELIKGESHGQDFFTSYDKQGRRISFYGDNHPDYAGNVVKAMASAKNGYSKVVELFADEIKQLDASKQEEREQSFDKITQVLEKDVTATVHSVNRLTPTIIEVIVHAPLQAQNFKPGQFYRLQNFETLAKEINGVKLLTEGIALTGAWNDPEKGLLSMIILEMGTSSRLCAALKPGEPVVVMGPTGTPTEIPKNETVLLAGGGLGNAVLFSIGKAMKQNGNKVLYFAGYKDSQDIFKQDEVEVGTDVVIWSNDMGDAIKPRRPQDKSFTGNIVQAMLNYSEGKLGDTPIALNEVDRVIVIGSDRMMAAVKQARFGVLKPHLKKNHIAIGSINSTMQCMMKEICAQCLQKHVDPETGKETKPVFSCFNQDQELDKVDFANLNERLQMNRLQEIMSGLYMDHLFSQQPVEQV